MSMNNKENNITPESVVLPDRGKAEGDYYKNGCLYCGKCHTKKEFVSMILNRQLRVPVLCSCEAAKAEKLRQERLAEEEAQRIRMQKASCIHDRALLNATFENADLSSGWVKTARKYVETWNRQKETNTGLLLYGGIGTGKTFCAGCIANALIEKDVPVLMTSFPKILNTLCGLYSEDKNGFLSEIMKYHLLIIDDFGIERDTEYAREQVYGVIDERYKTGLPLIVTTNKSLEEMKNPSDMMRCRIYDRVLSMCVPFYFPGESRRKAEAERKTKDAREFFKYVKEEADDSGRNNPENSGACDKDGVPDKQGTAESNACCARNGEESKGEGCSEGKTDNGTVKKTECSPCNG